ncbi:amidohydrolase family protein [Rhabdothermincola salaria]|uniref:amidohydrolase family protein n=1 Tax=Rhabdothermincola salaria TaxID=2903142 RepID=UPI001E4A1818|nr:amidohydrolase family protein [Rhabdothermincola salaria]MCD9624857.1 amidohydrolase [Rhabdothermincola salaria]
MDIPRIISVDDHVVEPPNLWLDRLPAKYQDRAPRVVREKVRMSLVGGYTFETGVPDGVECDVWYYDDLKYPFTRLSAAVGAEVVKNEPTTFDQIRKGCYDQEARLADMDANHVEASICFPNILPRFCGQTFLERDDKELALLCVKAYNDWMIEEWCAGPGKDRLIPLTMIPLWDVDLAVAEVRRCADLGSHNITFSENPVPLGLPSVHSGHWDPLFAVCEETDTVINMHIGSSSKMPSTAPDAPFIISSTLTFQNAMGSVLDYTFGGVFDRFPDLRVAYSEGQAGWLPYVLERADKLWEERLLDDTGFGSKLPQPPSTYMKSNIWYCIFDDETAMANRDVIGIDRLTFEVDYPHADSTFPHTKDVAERMAAKAGLNDHEIYRFFRGNAIELYHLDRYHGITE